MPQTPRLIYIHDPMCSWCWGFKPAFDTLSGRVAGYVEIERLLGGLAPDSERPMPAAMQARLEDTWRRIEAHIPGTRFNYDFWRDCAPRRSTWPACRAVIAARTLDAALELPMIEAIQHAYYLHARNPSDTQTLIGLATQIGLDGAAFAAVLDAAPTRAALDNEIGRARQLGATGFPSLRLQRGNAVWPVDIDYTDVERMRADIDTRLNGAARP